MKELGDRLKERRKTLGLTQKQVAKKAGLTTSSVTQWELGLTKPSGENLYILCRALQCKAEWLLYGNGDPEDSTDLPAGNIPHRPIQAYNRLSDLPPGEFVLVPRLDVKAAAGGGYENSDWPTEKDQVAYRTDFIRSSKAKTTKLVITTVSGDSMSPVIHDGDDALVDLGQNEIESGLVYTFAYKAEVKIKRLYLQRDILLIHSENTADPRYRFDEEVPASEIDTVKIIGRVVGYSSSRGL